MERSLLAKTSSRELLRQRAPMDAVFAYSLWNEAQVAFDHLPFTLSSGRVTIANGHTHDRQVTSSGDG